MWISAWAAASRMVAPFSTWSTCPLMVKVTILYSSLP